MKEGKRYVVIDHSNKGLGREIVNPNRLARKRAALRHATVAQDPPYAAGACKKRNETGD